MKDLRSPYIELAFAICIRAVEDYRAARCFIDRTPPEEDDKEWKKSRRTQMTKALRDTVSFFRSELFYQYSGLNGEQVLKQLEDECDNGYYGDSRNRWQR